MEHSGRVEPVTVRAQAGGRGVAWIGEGFDLFKQEPGHWIGLILVWFAISAALSIPSLDIVSVFLNPIFSAGVMLGCRRQAAGQGFRIGYLFEAFKGDRVGTLLLMVVIQIGLALVIALVVGGFAFLTMGNPLELQEHDLSREHLMSLMLVVLLAAALGLPLAMMVWFAPALIVLRRLGAWEAMLLSFRGCLKNWLAFLVYGVVALVLLLVAAIPLGLGLIVAIPVLTASIYTAYRDIFPEPDPAAPQGGATVPPVA